VTANSKLVIVVPFNLKWDQLSALYIFLIFILKVNPKDVIIRFEDEFKRVKDIPEDVLDVDVRVRYKDSGKQSATAYISTEDVLAIPGVAYLIKLLNHNNEHGTLKSQSDSLVTLIRRIPEVSHNVTNEEHRASIVDLFFPVLEAYFAAAAANLEQVEGMKNPFTMGNFEVLGQIAGKDVSEHITVLKGEFEKVDTRMKQAEERARIIVPQLFPVKAKHGMIEDGGHLITTDDKLVSAFYLKQQLEHSSTLRILVTRNRVGNYAIFATGGQSLTALAEVLQSREFNVWFHHTPKGSTEKLLNGSGSRFSHEGPSKVTPSQMISIVQASFTYVSRTDRGERSKNQSHQTDRPAQRPQPAPLTDEEREQIKKTANAIRPERTFMVTSPDGRNTIEGHVIVTDDQNVANSYFYWRKQIAILVVRTTTGHCTIMVKGKKSLDNLYEALITAEPKLWYYYNKNERQMLLNGNKQGTVPFSNLTNAQIVDLILIHDRRRADPSNQDDNDSSRVDSQRNSR
jgi:hypothetical protein